MSILIGTVEDLVKESLTDSSLTSYKRAWTLFREFQGAINRFDLHLPLDDSILVLFVAFLINKNFATSTIKTHLSALAFSHKILNFNFPSKNFLINKMLNTAQSGRSVKDPRLPITLPILSSILIQSECLSFGNYDRALFQAMCSTAFYAFMRSGEICDSQNTLQYESLSLDPLGACVVITFYKFKHSSSSGGWPVKIMAKPQLDHCPVKILSNYVRLRGSNPGPLFCSLTGNAISRTWFSKNLQACLQVLDIDHSRYKLHSFRIGAATTAMLSGMSNDEICTLGRWSSNAFKSYVRASGLTFL